jgi:UDP-N-acetylmuramoylalanine--D-glutamate ligase
VTEFAGQRVLVVGLGISGYAAARVLLQHDAKVSVTESGRTRPIEERAAALRRLGADVEIGGHDLTRLDADLAIVSPGIAPTAQIVGALVDQGVEMWSEVELATHLARCDFLAVTGTNGKTTTTALLAATLSQGGIPSVAAGNIGFPLVDAVMSIPEGGAIAVEISSAQLATTSRFAPRVAVLLNIAEDHTEWHGSHAAYVAAPARIVEHQDERDVFVVNADDPLARGVAEKARSRILWFSPTQLPREQGSIGVQAGAVLWQGNRLFGVEDVPLPGRAGLENAIAAAGAALAYGVRPDDVVAALRGFRSLPHRLEIIARVNDVEYIDDSKATNPHATLAAIGGLSRVVLIAGGKSRGIDLTPLAATVPPVETVIAMGETADQIEEVFRGLVPVQHAASMEEAVRKANAASSAGGSVLLSPGCASLDMYENYAARGDAFVRAVHELLPDE